MKWQSILLRDLGRPLFASTINYPAPAFKLINILFCFVRATALESQTPGMAEDASVRSVVWMCDVPRTDKRKEKTWNEDRNGRRRRHIQLPS
jgi:hypothetical protein